VRLFKNSEAFLKHLKRNEGLFSDVKRLILRLFENIFREFEAFDYKCEAFIKITRLSKTFSEKWRPELEI
jgi:hypothetical protein